MVLSTNMGVTREVEALWGDGSPDPIAKRKTGRVPARTRTKVAWRKAAIRRTGGALSKQQGRYVRAQVEPWQRSR